MAKVCRCVHTVSWAQLACIPCRALGKAFVAGPGTRSLRGSQSGPPRCDIHLVFAFLCRLATIIFCMSLRQETYLSSIKAWPHGTQLSLAHSDSLYSFLFRILFGHRMLLEQELLFLFSTFGQGNDEDACACGCQMLETSGYHGAIVLLRSP